MITKQDRVSDVLKRDATLVDVFTELSPAFERLRNPAMRKVMSRLVTVEQAARMAGVDADALVARLNGAQPERTTSTAQEDSSAPMNGAAMNGAATNGAATNGAPASLAAIPEDRIVVADVRDDLRRGQEPFSRIMAAKATVPAGGVLVVRAIFEPVPLYAVLAKQGFTHHTERLADDDWRVWFHRAPAKPGPAASKSESIAQGDATEAKATGDDTSGGDATDVDATVDDVVVLDVRGLEPPEPMVRTLNALEELPDGATLVQINVRVPRFLLPMLDERGYVYEVREQGPELVRLFIRRNGR